MRLRRMSDKPLRTSCVLARKSHADRTPVVGDHIDLAADRPSGSPIAIAARVTVLHHEIRHHAMDFETIKIIRASELYKIIDREWCVVGKKVDRERSFLGRNDRFYGAIPSRQCTPVIGVSVQDLSKLCSGFRIVR